MAKEPIETLTLNAAPSTTDGSTAPTSWTLAGDTDAYYDVYRASMITLFVVVHQAPTGTTLTYDVKLQHSPDGESGWDDIPGGAITQFTTAAGTEAVSVPGPGTSDAKAFARYVRVVEQFGSADCVYSRTITLAQTE